MILNWNSEEKSWKFLENFSFYQNFQFSGSTTLYISCHNLAELWPRTKIFSPKYLSRISLKVSRKHTYGNPSHLGDIGKDIRGVKMTPLGVYVDQKSLVFPGLRYGCYTRLAMLLTEHRANTSSTITWLGSGYDRIVNMDQICSFSWTTSCEGPRPSAFPDYNPEHGQRQTVHFNF